MKKYLLIFFVLPMLLLGGCTGPDNSEIAFMGLMGTPFVFLLSLFALILFIRKDKEILKEMNKNKPLFIGISLVLLFLTLGFMSTKGFSEFDFISYEGLPFFILFSFIVASILTSPANILYTFLLFFILKKSKNMRKSYLIPILITVIYVTTLGVVYFTDHSKDFPLLLRIWVWPFGVIGYLINFIDKLFN